MGFYMLGVVLIAYSSYEMDETFDVVQEKKMEGKQTYPEIQHSHTLC